MAAAHFQTPTFLTLACLAALDGWILVVFVIVPSAARLFAGGFPCKSSLFVFLIAWLPIFSAASWWIVIPPNPKGLDILQQFDFQTSH